jgi:HlyD family secretion protein
MAKRRLKQLGGLVVAALLVAGGYWGYDRWLAREPLPEGLIQANGRIEGDRYTIASEVGGRVKEVLVREGADVRKGEILVRLDDETRQARLSQARRQVSELEARVAAAKATFAMIKKEVPLKVKAAEASIDEARASVSEAEAREGQAARDYRRYRELLADRAVDPQTAEHARLELEVARRELDSAWAALRQALQERSQAKLGYDRIEAEKHQVAALEAKLNQARAAEDEAESIVEDLTVMSPVSGVVLVRAVEPGEVVQAGAPLMDLVSLDRLYLKAYVSEIQMGKLHLGAQARIHVDAFPGRTFRATVRHIADRAEFTPKEVQTPEERVKLVYAVKLYLDENPGHRLTPGLPADAVIRWKEDAPWTEPRW